MAENQYHDVLPDDAEATVRRILQVAYPHPEFPDEPYQRCAAAIVEASTKTPWLAVQLGQGLRDLDARASGRFVELPDVEALSILEAVADAGFFQAIRATAITSIYVDPQVWEVLGYEGASFDRGGYLDRGFADLDWLPEPSLDRAAEIKGASA